MNRNYKMIFNWSSEDQAGLNQVKINPQIQLIDFFKLIKTARAETHFWTTFRWSSSFCSHQVCHWSHQHVETSPHSAAEHPSGEDTKPLSHTRTRRLGGHLWNLVVGEAVLDSRWWGGWAAAAAGTAGLTPPGSASAPSTASGTGPSWQRPPASWVTGSSERADENSEERLDRGGGRGLKAERARGEWRDLVEEVLFPPGARRTAAPSGGLKLTGAPGEAAGAFMRLLIHAN